MKFLRLFASANAPRRAFEALVLLAAVAFWQGGVLASDQSSPAWAQGVPPDAVVLTDAQSSYRLGLHLELLEDPSGALTLAEVTSPERAAQFVPSTEQTPNLGFTASAYWIRFRLRNETTATSDWRLALHDARVGYVDLYRPAPDATGGSADFVHKRAGRLLPFTAREIPQREFVFTLPLPPQAEETIYLRLESNTALSVPLTLWTPQALAQHDQGDYLFFGLCYGVLIVMWAYNLFLLFALRDRGYLYYVLATVAFGLNQAARDGFGQQYLWPAWPNRFGIELSGGLSMAFALVFTASFLHTRLRVPRLHRLLQTCLLIDAGLLLLAPFVRILPLSNAMAMFGGLLILIAGIHAWRRGHPSARYFVGAWSFIVFSGGLFLLPSFRLMPVTPLMDKGLMLGVSSFAVLWSLALADRINLLRAG